jgi:hypothetical protein
MSTTTAPATDTPTIVITEEIVVKASIETTFNSLLVQMGRQNETPDGKPLPMIIEPKPGGRWFRDLGGDNGHLWGLVQSIKRPTLGTRIYFKHTLVVPVPDEFRADHMAPGWSALHARIKRAAESQHK